MTTNEHAQRNIGVLQFLLKQAGKTAYCSMCPEKGSMGSRHDACGGYFTFDQQCVADPRYELPAIRGMFYCANCADATHGAWASRCSSCDGGIRTSREQSTGPEEEKEEEQDPNVATLHYSIDPSKVVTARDSERVLDDCWKLFDKHGAILVEVVGSGIQPMNSIMELTEWLQRVENSRKK